MDFETETNSPADPFTDRMPHCLNDFNCAVLGNFHTPSTEGIGISWGLGMGVL